jgi:hypothetical protein
MAKQKVIDGAAPELPILESDEAVQLDNEARLQQILVAFGQAPDNITYKVSVLRIVNGKEVWLCHLQQDQLETIAERLRDEWSGGDFVVRVYEKNQAGTKIKTQFYYSVEKPKAIEARAQQSNELAALVELVRDGQNRMLAVVEQKMTAPAAAAPVDAMAIVEKVFALQQKMTAPASTDSVDAITRAVELIEKVRDVAGTGGGGEGETSILGLLKSFLTPEVVGGIARAIGAPVPIAAPRQQPALAAAPSGQAAPIAPDQIAPMDLLRAQIPVFIDRARANSDPNLWAEVLADTLRDFPATVDLIMQRDNLVPALMIMVPEAQPYRQWFFDLITDFRDFIRGTEAANAARNVVNGDATESPDGTAVGAGGDS